MPILHGCCSYGIACHAATKMMLDYDKTKMNGFDVRFSAPVFLGESQVVEMWKYGNVILNRTNTDLTLPVTDLGSVSPSTNQYLNLVSDGKTEKILDYILYRKDHLIPKNRPELQVVKLKSNVAWKGRRVFGADIEMKDLSDHYPTLMGFEF